MGRESTTKNPLNLSPDPRKLKTVSILVKITVKAFNNKSITRLYYVLSMNERGVVPLEKLRETTAKMNSF
jgi:hypothetical protein